MTTVTGGPQTIETRIGTLEFTHDLVYKDVQKVCGGGVLWIFSIFPLFGPRRVRGTVLPPGRYAQRPRAHAR